MEKTLHLRYTGAGKRQLPVFLCAFFISMVAGAAGGPHASRGSCVAGWSDAAGELIVAGGSYDVCETYVAGVFCSAGLSFSAYGSCAAGGSFTEHGSFVTDGFCVEGGPVASRFLFPGSRAGGPSPDPAPIGGDPFSGCAPDDNRTPKMAPVSNRMDLNGTWDFVPKTTPVSPAEPIEVPGFYVWMQETPDGFLFVDPHTDNIKVKEGIKEASFSRTFTVPGSWSGKQVFLHFNAVNFVTNILVNEGINTSPIGMHSGGFVPFEVNITPYVHFSGIDTLRVSIKYNSERFLDNTDRPVWPVGFYGNYWHLGIVDSVYLEARPSVYIDDIQIITSVSAGSITARTAIVNGSDAEETLDLVLGVEDGGVSALSLGTYSVTVPPHDTLFDTRTQAWQNPELWYPGHPHLYFMRASLRDGGSLIHEKTVRFGFREIGISGNQYTLNGIRQNLLGDNLVLDSSKQYWQYLVPSPESWSDILDSLLALHFNCIRLHCEPSPPYVLNLCDEKGMLVVAESALYYRQGLIPPGTSTVYLDSSRVWLKEWVKRDRNHPSVFMWSAENEMNIWGDQHFTNAQLLTLGNAIQEMDATRPILYEGDRDLGGLAATASWHYIFGFPCDAATWPADIFTLANSVYSNKPTSNSEFEWSRLTIPERDRYRRQSVMTRTCRMTDYADIRPYRADWAWHPNPDFAEHDYGSYHATDGEILFLKNSMNPVAAFDINYFRYAFAPDTPSFNEETAIRRAVSLFNDEHEDTEVTLSWRVLLGGEVQSTGSFDVQVPLGTHVDTAVTFRAPYVLNNAPFQLELRTEKAGELRFSEAMVFFSRNTGIGLPKAVSSVQITLSGRNAVLAWPAVTQNVDGNPITVSRYVLHSASDVAFNADLDSVTGITSPGYTDDVSGILGDPDGRIFYRVITIDQAGRRSQTSDIYGIVQYGLSVTQGTDFNDIALPLSPAGITDARGLLNVVPGINSIARWQADRQGFQQYIPDLSFTNFPVSAGQPYSVNATQDTVFALIGRWMSNPSYSLITTGATDFNALMLPLHRTEITRASHLLADIPGCNSVASWDASIQGYDQYIPSLPATDFDVEIGHAYFVNVTQNSTWPMARNINGDSKGGACPEPNPAKPAGDFFSGPGSFEAHSRLPHLAYGRIEGNISGAVLTAYLKHRRMESISSAGPFCRIGREHWTVQCSGFGSSWQAGDTLVVAFSLPSGKGVLAESPLSREPADAFPKVTFEEGDETPVHSGLAPAYPNPFNPTVTLPFGIGKPGRVCITVYNARGQSQKRLCDAVLGTGHHTLSWDGRDEEGRLLPSGLYIVRMEHDGTVHHRKIIFLR